MNPLFKQRGMTPTAAIAFRAEAQAARQAAAASIKEQAAASNISLSKGAYAESAKAKLNATAKLGPNGQPEATKFTWNPATKTVSRS